MEHKKAAENSAVLMACTFASRLLGIVKARAIATVFGASGIADVINFTFNIPNNFRKLFAEGALSSAYIPVFTAAITMEEGKNRSSAALLARMQGFQLLVSVPLVLLTWWWRGGIIGFLSDFSDPSHIRLSGELLVYFMVFLGTISFAALYGGVLQSHGSFVTAAVAPLLFSVSVISSVYLLSDRLGAYSMALGVVGGGLLQAVATFARLRTLGYRFAFSFDFKDRDFQRVMRAWAPVTVTAVIAIVTQQVAFYFASTLSEGTVTAFSNAIILWQAPYGIFYTAIATVFFPAMVSAFHRGRQEELGQLVARGLIYIATFLIPAALAMAVLRNETTAVLLQSGRFVLEDTVQTGTILIWFVIGMPVVAWYGFMQRYCFSTDRFRLTLHVGVAVSLLDIAIMYAGVRSGWGGGALSFANTASYAAGAILLWIGGMRSGQVAFPVGTFVGAMLRLLFANIPLAALAMLYLRLANPTWWHLGSTWANAGILCGLYAAAIACTVISYRLMGIEFLSVLRKR